MEDYELRRFFNDIFNLLQKIEFNTRNEQININVPTQNIIPLVDAKLTPLGEEMLKNSKQDNKI